MIQRIPAICRVLLLCSALSSTASAADKSGVTPNTISLPKGPGAIEGLGESFQPTLNTGTAKYGIFLKVPPGTAGHTPEVSLNYDGGTANGPLGFGWSLHSAYIQRRSDKGIPTYGQYVGFARTDSFINEMKEELVPVTNGYYFCKNEGPFIRYRQSGDGWEGTLPDGTRLEFGITDQGRIQDANTSPPHVFSWLIEKETDTHGNTITYSYTSFPDSQNANQKYLGGIRYGPGQSPWSNFHFVSFIYEDRPDWFEDCRSGFVIRTGKRLKEIVVGTHGPILQGHQAGDWTGDGQTDYLDRKYVLEYVAYAGTNSHWSLLGKVLPVGADGTSALPPSTFGYSLSNPPDTVSASGRIIGGSNEPPVVMDNPLADFVDLNGDGLPDILLTEPGFSGHTAYVNRGPAPDVGADFIRWEQGAQMVSEDGRALQFDLQATAPIAHLADMDGDGVADLAVTALDGSVFYFANRAQLAWGPRKDMSIQDSAPPSPFGRSDVRTADLDFDKRIDIIQSIATGNGADYRVWFNLGSQSYSPSITIPQASGFLFSTPGVQVTDFNGDRVPDIARIGPASIIVTAGLGYGRFAEPITVAIPDLVLDDTQVARANLTDINGDGLTDLVLERAAPGELWYWLNLGNYTLSNRKVITDMPTAVGAGAVVRWADLDGNGTTDLVYADSASIPRLQTIDVGQLLNAANAPNVLTTISNGIGRVTLIGYAPSTRFMLEDAAAGKPWSGLMPNPVQVVASVTNLDSLGHQYVSRFRYHDGYYDPVEKQFRGFAVAEQIDAGDPTAPTLVTRSCFDTGRAYESMKGKLLSLSSEQEDGKVFSNETNLWTVPPVTLYTGVNGTNVVYAYPTGRLKVISELGQGAPRRLEAEFAYDNYGNQTAYNDYGIVEGGDRSAWNDERLTSTDYALNLDAWNVRHPRRQEIKDANGVVISRTDYFYDDETFSGNNPGWVTAGNLTMRREWVTPSNAIAYVAATRTKYDAYGNPVLLLDPLGTAPGGSADVSQGHVREIRYDSEFYSLPVAEIIYVGNGSAPLVYQAGYDEGFATATFSLNFNTNRTVYGYDTHGRLINIVRPYDTSEFPTVEYEYALAQPFGPAGVVNFIETRQLDKPPDGLPGSDHRSHYFISRQFLDGLGRPLLTKTEAEPAFANGPPRVIIRGAVRFNARQRVSATINPCYSVIAGTDLDSMLGFEDVSAPDWRGAFSDGGQLINLGFAAAHKNLVAYDATLREVAVTNQDGTFRRKAYEPLLTRSYDENQTDPNSAFFGNSMAHYQDGLGRLVEVDEVVKLNDDGTPAGAPNTWRTRYEYDVNDQLTRITDSQNNVKVMAYDGLKRKVSMHDPDRGTMLYAYDDVSNLSATTDARNQRIVYSYDGANRLLSETYTGSSLSPRRGEDRGEGPVNVAYHYDEPAGFVDNGDGTRSRAQNTRGMLAFVSDSSGEEHTSYDQRARVEYVVKRVPDPVFLSPVHSEPSTVLVSYRTGFEYDSLDRITRLVYPDNDQVKFGYNERNQLQQIMGGPSGSVISNLTYWPSDQQEEMDYGNGVSTRYGYDARLRLTSLLAAPSGSPSPFVALGYVLDGVSNLRRIEDQRPGSAVPAGDRRRNTQLFEYDPLYRLVHAQYSFNAPGSAPQNDGSIACRYDRIGNKISQISDIQQFERGSSVTQLGTMSYGGTGGRFGRAGRAAGDPPGPHALTAVSEPSTNGPQPRVYPYDDNGNLMSLDGLVCTWDFKDRLVSIENETSRTMYTYDFTDRRIAKMVEGDALDSPTLYVNKYFEVREHEAPTKYIFAANTRIAQVTGSLSSNLRVQRLRLYPGWNLSSLAVAVTNASAQLFVSAPALEAVYRWDPPSGNFVAVGSGENLAAGTVLWLKSPTNGTLSVIGSYHEPTNLNLPAGRTFIAGAGLEAWSPANQLFQRLSLFTPDPGTDRWNIFFDDPLRSFSDFPRFISPGEAIFVEADSAVQLEIPEPALRILYYHQDHLGSATVLTDGAGRAVEEDAYYPFGVPRVALQLEPAQAHYGFTQKERDRESGLTHFEARYLAGVQGRFISPDPLVDAHNFGNPQDWNCYAYTLNNPLKYTDPRGLYVWDASLGGSKKDEELKDQPDVVSQRKAFREALTLAKETAKNIKDPTDKALVTRALDSYGDEGVDNGLKLGTKSGGSAGHTHPEGGGKVAFTFRPDVQGKSLARSLAHEGTHIADHQAVAKRQLKHQTDYEFEFKGYTAESILGQAMGETVKKETGEKIWDKHWKDLPAQEIQKNRAEAINHLLANPQGIYKITPENPDRK